MKHACLLVAALVLASPPFVGADNQTTGKAPAKAVVVDPQDLRAPIPDPGAGLTEKYDGKLVRFSGRVKTAGQDAKTKTYWYDLQTEVVHAKGVANGKKGIPAPKPTKGSKDLVKEVVVVRAYFATAQANLRPKPASDPVTVEGRAEISLVDGSMAIRQAKVLDPQFLSREVPAKP